MQETQSPSFDTSVGVVIPTYQRDEVLKRAIKSVVNQTHPPEEIIIVDGGSDFDVEEAVAHLADNITVIIEDENKGPAAARNLGVDNLNTDLVAFLDSDDYWEPEKIEKQVKLVKETDAEFVYCDQWIVDEEGNVRRSNKVLDDENIWEKLLDGWTGPNPSAIMVERDLFQKFGGFDVELSSCEDHDFWMRLAMNDVSFGCVYGNLSYFTRQKENRISYSPQRRLPGINKFLKKWRPIIISEEGILAYHIFKWRYYIHTYVLFKTAFQNGDYKTALGIFLRYLFANPIFHYKVVQKVRKLASKV